MTIGGAEMPSEGIGVDILQIRYSQLDQQPTARPFGQARLENRNPAKVGKVPAVSVRPLAMRQCGEATPPGAFSNDQHLVMAWSVGRLGRSLRGLVEFLEELRRCGSTFSCTSRGSTPGRRGGAPCSR